MTTKSKRILTGDNATGNLHLGHYVGSLQNRVSLQNDYDMTIIIADMHALAYPKYVERSDVVADASIQVLIDNLSVGLDPSRVKFFTESSIPEIYELGIIFSMLVTHNRALRNPTLKEEIKDKSLGDNYSLGFINFPILQAADILCVKASLVPVGEDQLPHIELTREVARKFNTTYKDIFPEPEGLVGEVKRLIGTDGNTKMTKSLGNAIFLSEDETSLKEKVMKMFTDPKRIRSTDPGTVEGNPVFIYHDAFNKNTAEVADLKDRYLKGTVGDVEVKDKLFKCLNDFMAPIREKRAYYLNNLSEVKEILNEGNKFVRQEASKTLGEVLEALKFKKA